MLDKNNDEEIEGFSEQKFSSITIFNVLFIILIFISIIIDFAELKMLSENMELVNKFSSTETNKTILEVRLLRKYTHIHESMQN